MMSPSSICSVSGVSSSLMPRPLYWNVRNFRQSCPQGDLFLSTYASFSFSSWVFFLTRK